MIASVAGGDLDDSCGDLRWSGGSRRPGKSGALWVVVVSAGLTDTRPDASAAYEAHFDKCNIAPSHQQSCEAGARNFGTVAV